MNGFGFSDEEYSRVRGFLFSAFDASPCVFDEAEMLEKLRSGEWHLLTTEHAAAVLQFGEINGELFANVLLLGGKRGGSLREIMRANLVLCEVLQRNGFAYIVGEPRKEFHAFLLKNGFEQEQKEFKKRLN